MLSSDVIYGFDLVYNVCDLFDELTDDALVTFGGLSFRETEVDLGKIHANRFRNESFEESMHEVKGDAHIFRGAG